jgi:Uma2 family endonuclease
MRFANAEEWHRSLGSVPLSRVVFDPLPGTASERDLLRLTDAEDVPCELIDGTLVAKAGSCYESIVGTRLLSEILGFVMQAGLGIVVGATAPVRLRPGLVRMPDVTFFSARNFLDGRIPHVSIADFVPDLVVELLDEQNTTAEMRLKLQEYFEAGAALAWLIDPEAEIATVHRSAKGPGRALTVNDSLDGEGVIPGFSMSLAELFHFCPREPRVSVTNGQAHRI